MLYVGKGSGHWTLTDMVAKRLTTVATQAHGDELEPRYFLIAMLFGSLRCRGHLSGIHGYSAAKGCADKHS